jgi:hypothetical protein
MNEQIEKIYGEACITAGYLDEREFLEKFAELIVEECVGIYSKINNGNLHMGTDNYLEALHKTFRS